VLSVPFSGRRTAAYLYVLTYSICCITKHSPDFSILMIGRIFGGIATSLLFSAFESWLVAEHFKLGFSGKSITAAVPPTPRGCWDAVTAIINTQLQVFDQTCSLYGSGGTINPHCWSVGVGVKKLPAQTTLRLLPFKRCVG